MEPGIHLAETEEEKEAVFRFRYDVYVEEMGRYGAVADHEHRLLFEPEDDRYVRPPDPLPDNPQTRRDTADYQASMRSTAGSRSQSSWVKSRLTTG